MADTVPHIWGETEEGYAASNCGSAHCKTTGFREGMFYQGSGFDREVAEEIKRRYDSYTALLAALKEVPDPIDRVWCDSCTTSPVPLVSETVKTRDGHEYRRDYFKHDDTCWYGKVCAAIALAEKDQPS